MDPATAAAHQRGQPSTSSVRSFDDSNEHATDYISGMYHDPAIMSPPSSSPPPYRHQQQQQQQQYPPYRPPLSTLNHHPSPPIRKKVIPPPPPPKDYSSTSPSSASPTQYNASVQSTPAGSRTSFSESVNSQPSPIKSPPLKSPTSTRLRIQPPPPSPPLSTMPLSGLDQHDDGSSPHSPDEIAKELSNLQAFKRMSLDTSNLVSDPDLPSSNRVSIPDYSDLFEASVDSDAARLLWVPAHLHPEISANDDWKDFVQRRVEETKSTGTISRVKSIGGGSTNRPRLSRSKSILSRQIDALDEETWQTYSDAGHKELERRSSRTAGAGKNDSAGEGERHMITVSELEKLEALIREGALERTGRPLSAESIESVEGAQQPAVLAADIPVPLIGEEPPLMPVMRGTLRRRAHTSMRSMRRGGLAAGRTARRSSESKKGADARISQETTWNDDGTTSVVEQPSTAPPITGPVERSPSMPIIGVDSLAAPQEADKTRTSAPAILEQFGGKNLPRPTSDGIQQQQQADPFLEDSNLLLGQVQPRHNRRPPLRRQTGEIAQSLPLPSRSPTKEQPPPPPPEEKPLKKSPVSPSFPTTQQQPPPSDYVTPTEPEPSQLTVPIVPPPPSPSPPPTQSKKGAWSRLFNSSSDDEPVKEKPSNKGKPKKAASLAERPKPGNEKSESRPSSDLDRSKSLVEPTPAPAPPSPVELPSTSVPTPPPQSKPGKKESGLFASLFGSKKKSESKDKQTKSQDSTAPSKGAHANKSQYQEYGQGGWDNGANPGGSPPVLNYYYTRFPIHIERAIYRLSHIKLANPRRPLLQQVLLSNFMYGYLNLINKTAQPQQPAQPEPQEIPNYAPYPGEPYAEKPAQLTDDHVFYSTDDQVDYYGQDYYGAEYEEDQDESILQGHDGNAQMGYGYAQTNGRTEESDGAEQYVQRDSRGYKRYGGM